MYIPAAPGIPSQQSKDVLALIEEQVNLVRHDKEAGVLAKARCVGYLGGIALKAIEAGDVAARVEALEAVLKQRNAFNNGSG